MYRLSARFTISAWLITCAAILGTLWAVAHALGQ